MSIQLIQTLVLDGTTASFTLNDGGAWTGYTDLILRVSGRTSSSGALAFMYVNGAERSSGRGLNGRGTSGPESFSSFYVYMNNSGDTTNTFGNADVEIPNFAQTTRNKGIQMHLTEETNAGVSIISFQAGIFPSNDAITSIGMTTLSGNFVQYTTVSLYGRTAGSDGTTTVS